MLARDTSYSSAGMILSGAGLQKSFGGIRALRDVDIELNAAEVLAIAGENGAGKSTLIKILTGVVEPDSGEITVDGHAQRLTPARARDLGIAAVTQELSVLDHLSVAENISLGREPRGRFGVVNRTELDRRAVAALERVGLSVGTHVMGRDLSLANKQLVEIGKALAIDPRILILDEPTSGLREAEVNRLLELVLRLRDEGCSVVIITHRMKEMFQVADRIMVLKDGAHMATLDLRSTSPDEVVRLMVGREVGSLFPANRGRNAPGSENDLVLRVKDLRIPGTMIRGVSLDIPRGNIVALAGLAGHGQIELLEGISGLRPGRGQIVINGRPWAAFRRVAQGVKAGIALIPEDRKTEGLVLPMSVGQNISLPTLHRRSHFGWIDSVAERTVAEKQIDSMQIRPADASVRAGQLSGGNQQKIVIGKWLAAEPKIILAADPTRGIDVATKREIFVLLRRLSDDGVGVLLVSTDLTEIVGVADIVHVMSEGRIIETFAGDAISEEALTEAAFRGVAE